MRQKSKQFHSTHRLITQKLEKINFQLLLFTAIYPHKKMDGILTKRREIFFHNLVLLGLDRVAFEKKHGISFHKDMFVVPNKKGYEVVTHFLFSKLNAATGKDYNLPWPLLDKEFERLFQKTCYAHLTEFSQEKEVKFPHIVPSLLATFGGDRFYEVYLALSCYVLNKTIRKNQNINLISSPIVTRDSLSSAKDILQISTILSMQRFKDTQKVTCVNHLIWKKFARNLSECLQKLKVLLKTNEDLLKENRSIVTSLYCRVPEENLNLEELIEKCVKCSKPMKQQWKILENFFTSETKLWQYLASEIGKNSETEILNGQDFNIDITHCLPEEYFLELKKAGISSSEEDGKLSVVRFINLFMAYLKCITELLKRADLSNLHERCFVPDASSTEADLNSIESLNKKLSEEIIPELEERIQMLKLTPWYKDQQEIFELTSSNFYSSLPVLKYDPETFKEINPFREEMFRLPISRENMSNKIPNDHLLVSKTLTEVDNSCVKYNTYNQDSIIIETNAIARENVSNSFIPKLVMKEENILKSVDSRDSDTAKVKKKLSLKVSVEDCPLSSKLNISDLAPDTPFRMRESWLNEESLNDMTLPNISFGD